MKDLVCPYCGSTLSFDYINVGSSYYRERVVGSFECDNYDCWATWDSNFHATQPSKLDTVPDGFDS